MKRADVSESSVFQMVMIVTGIVVIIAGMMHARPVLIPLMMATVIAIISSGPITWFQKKGMPQWLAILLVMVLMCCIALLTGLVVGSSAKDFIHNLPEYEDKLRQQMQHLYAFLDNKGIHLKGKGINDILDPASAMKYAGALLSVLGNLLSAQCGAKAFRTRSMRSGLLLCQQTASQSVASINPRAAGFITRKTSEQNASMSGTYSATWVLTTTSKLSS